MRSILWRLGAIMFAGVLIAGTTGQATGNDPLDLPREPPILGWVESGIPGGETIHPNLADVLDEAPVDQRLRVIVQYGAHQQIDPETLVALGATVHYEVQAAPMLFVMGTPSVIHSISALDEVRAIHFDEPIEFDLDSAVHTGRAYNLWGVEEPAITIDNGTRIDGSGVGVAVVDSGVNAMHSDLEVGRVTAMNLHAIGIPVGTGYGGDVLDWQEQDNTESGDHGSHVAGIVAGSGELSGGEFVGSAPGAMLYGFGSNVLGFWYTVAAWDWIYQNGADQNPPIRIITNSWGYGHGACELDHPLTQVQKRLVLDADIVMTFSAGNGGGDGSSDQGRTQYKCPWQGHLGVASMNDESDRNRDGPLSSFSSRGDIDEPHTWPHISGPGQGIVAVSGGTTNWGALCLLPSMAGVTQNCYTSKSGTSMSTPFVAGVVAMILQARPDLKPADVQYILQETAYKFGEGHELDGREVVYHADPNGDYRYHGGHYAHGHGLVDAEAAVAFALTYDPADHPVVYGFDETPAPLWEYELTVRDSAPQGVSEEAAIPGFLVLVVVAVAACSARLAGRRA